MGYKIGDIIKFKNEAGIFQVEIKRAQQLTMTISRGWQISSMTMVFHCL